MLGSQNPYRVPELDRQIWIFQSRTLFDLRYLVEHEVFGM
jgi:hypothetical protein